jgi:hypothetical protein
MDTKKTVIAVVLLLIFGTIIALGVYQSQLHTRQYTVDEYFDVSVGIEPWAGDKVFSNGTVAIIHSIVVTVKAVEGDAHGVIIQSWAGSESAVLEDIAKGESKTDYMISTEGARFTRGTDGKYTVGLHILSLEASGEISVKFS